MTQEHYWSICIESNWIQAAIWTIEESATKVVATGAVAPWETEEDLVTAADTSLSSAVSELPNPDVEPSKTVFGVSPSWVSEGQIKREHLDKIRQICTNLSLEPTGFVVISEAIAHFIKADEGAPLNGVVIGVGIASLDISVFRLGNLSGSIEVGRSVNIVDDVVEGLTRFQTNDHLPSRFVIYNGKSGELEEARQALIQADWMGELKEKITFLHTPQVEIMEPDRKIVAVSLAGASEIANVSSVIVAKKPEEPLLLPDEELPQDDAESAPTPEPVIESEATPEELGFVVNEQTEELESRLPDETDDNLSEPSGEAADHVSPSKANPLVSVLASVKPQITNLTQKLKTFKLPQKPAHPTHQLHNPKPIPIGKPAGLSFKPKSMHMFGIIGGAILVLLVAAYWFLPKAEVTIFVAPQTLEKNMDVTVDTSLSSANVSARAIPGQTKTITVSGEKTTSATGRKTVGEKAKGNVEIRNGTSVGIKVNAGTTLFGPNNLKFVLDNQASVSAAESPSSPGGEEVSVTAESIGAEYNLAKDETFKVGNYPKSEVDAVVLESFTGGSSREITAVSTEDQRSIESSLTEELTTEGQEQFISQVLPDEVFVTDSIETKVVSKEFSGKVGDEASTVKLSLELELTGVVVRKADLNMLAVETLESQVPSGFALREDQVDIDFENAGKSGDTAWKFDTTFEANLLPDIKQEEIAKKITGRNSNIAQDYFTTIPGFVRAQMKISPRFPGIFGTLPRITKNIEVFVAAEK